MLRVIFIIAVTFCAHAWADPITYNQINPTHAGKDGAFRDFWDSKRFCYASQPTEVCLPITDMQEVKLRYNGGLSTDPSDAAVYNQLSTSAKQIAAKYSKLYVRYLAIGDNGDVIVHVFFNYLMGAQTIFVMGTMNPANETFTPASFSYGSQIELDSVALVTAISNGSIKTMAQQLSRIRDADAQEEFIRKTTMPDIIQQNLERIQIAKEVVDIYEAQKTGHAPMVSKP